MKSNKPFLSLFACLFIGSTIEFVISKLSLNTLTYTLMHLSELIILIAALFFINKIDYKKTFKDFKKTFKKNILKYFIIFIIGYLLTILSNIIISKYAFLPSNEEGIRLEFQTHLINALIETIILAPIFEELFFRYSFKDLNNKYIYLLITTLFFAFGHISNTTEILYLIPYSITGFIYGYTFLKTNNILYSIILHILNNVITLLIVLFL